MHRLALGLLLLAGCATSGPAADVRLAGLDAGPRELGGSSWQEEASGPVIRFAAGVADGVPFQLVAFDSGAMRCVGIELDGVASSGCMPRAELPDDDVLSRLAGGGTLNPVNPEAGLAPREVTAVWVELGNGRRVDGQIVDLRPALDTSVYFLFLPQHADERFLVAAGADGELLRRNLHQ